jgi:hypothetical protein
MLAEVGASARRDDAQLVRVIPRELGSFGAAGQLDGSFWASHSALAIGDERKQR